MKRFYFKVPVALMFCIDAETEEQAVTKAVHALQWLDDNDLTTADFGEHEARFLALDQAGAAKSDIFQSTDLDDAGREGDE